MAHIIDDQGFGPFSSILPVPVDIPTGWECPRCKRMYSPQTGQCVPCSPPPQPFAGPLPRPKPGLFPLDLGPGTPMLKVPVDEPDPEPRRHGHAFGGFPVTGTESPPRHPMCKCTPPAHLIADPDGVRLVRLTGDWAEIFTGTQARFLDEARIQADVEFRLTPADGETGD